MEATHTTKDKKNSLRIIEIIKQIIFQDVLERLPDDLRDQEHVRSYHAVKSAQIANKIVRSDKIEIILKRRKKL